MPDFKDWTARYFSAESRMQFTVWVHKVRLISQLNSSFWNINKDKKDSDTRSKSVPQSDDRHFLLRAAALVHQRESHVSFSGSLRFSQLDDEPTLCFKVALIARSEFSTTFTLFLLHTTTPSCQQQHSKPSDQIWSSQDQDDMSD